MTPSPTHPCMLRSLLLLAALVLSTSSLAEAQRTRRGRTAPAPQDPPAAQGEDAGRRRAPRETAPQHPGAQAPTRTHASGAGASALAGTWEGFYLQGAKPAGLRLTLRTKPPTPITPQEAWARERLRRRRAQLSPSARAVDPREPLRLEGELAFYPFPSRVLRPGRGPAGPQGSYAVEVELNPSSGAFHVSPGAWVEQPRGAVNAMFLAGLLDPDEPALLGSAGTGPGTEAAWRQPFLLWRPGAGSEVVGKLASLEGPTMPPQVTPDFEQLNALQKAFTDELRRLQQEAAALAPTDLAGRQRLQDEMNALQAQFQTDMLRLQSGGAESAISFEELVAWLQDTAGAHAELTRDGKLQLDTLYQAQGLFADEVFAPVFGKPVDALEADERYWLGRSIQAERKAKVADRTLMLSLSVILDALGPNYPLVVGRELVQRRLRKLRAQVLRELPRRAVTPEAFEDLAAIDEAAAIHFAGLWSEEQEEVRQALEAARKRLADDVLMARAVRDASAVDDADPTAALRLSTWSQEQIDVSPYVSPDAWHAARAKVDRRLDELLADDLAERVGRLASLGEGDAEGDGLTAVRAGANWYRELMASFGFAGARPGVKDAVARLTARRPADLERATPAIAARLDAAQSVSEIDTFLAELLCVPGDLDSGPGAALRAQATTRRAAIDRALFLARFSPREQELMVSDGVVDVPATVTEPPTGEEIRLAYLREVEWLGGKMLDHRSAQVSMPGMNMLGLSNDLTIRDVQVLRTKADTPTSFYCEYVIDMRMQVGESFRELLDDSIQGRMAEGMMRMANEAGPFKVVDRFQLTSSGWRSPTIRERGIESIADFVDTVTDSVRSAAEVFGF